MNSVHERQVLLACLKGIDASACALVADLGEKDWDALVRLAGRRGVQPLLYQRLTEAGSAVRVPESIRQRLLEAYLKNGARNGLLYLDLQRVLTVLQGDGISVIVLKGAHLAELAYPDRALRPMCDIDLMVKRTALARTADRLRGIGYQSQVEDPEQWLADNPFAKHLPPFFKPPNPRIEVHWTISAASLPDGEVCGLWRRARAATVAGVETHVLSPEDLLVHLALHGCASHTFNSGPRFLWDLQAALNRYAAEMNWDLVRTLAGEWQAQRSLYLSLRLANEYADARVSAEALAALRPADFKPQWMTAAIERMTVEVNTEYSDVDAMQPGTAVANLFVLNSPANRHGSLLRCLFPPRDYMAIYMRQYHSQALTPARRYTCHWTRLVDWLGRLARLSWYSGTHGGEAWRHLRDQRNRVRLERWLERI
jgi:hypothetical protein